MKKLIVKTRRRLISNATVYDIINELFDGDGYAFSMWLVEHDIKIDIDYLYNITEVKTIGNGNNEATWELVRSNDV